MNGKTLLVIGVLMMLLGGGLMVAGKIRYKDTDPVVKELDLHKTETKEKGIPVVFTGALLGVGAAIAIIGALKTRR
jgi:hypothetical protein